MSLFAAWITQGKSTVGAGYMATSAEHPSLREWDDMMRCIFGPARAAITICVITGRRTVGKDR